MKKVRYRCGPDYSCLYRVSFLRIIDHINSSAIDTFSEQMTAQTVSLKYQIKLTLRLDLFTKHYCFRAYRHVRQAKNMKLFHCRSENASILLSSRNVYTQPHNMQVLITLITRYIHFELTTLITKNYNTCAIIFHTGLSMFRTNPLLGNHYQLTYQLPIRHYQLTFMVDRLLNTTFFFPTPIQLYILLSSACGIQDGGNKKL